MKVRALQQCTYFQAHKKWGVETPVQNSKYGVLWQECQLLSLLIVATQCDFKKHLQTGKNISVSIFTTGKSQFYPEFKLVVVMATTAFSESAYCTFQSISLVSIPVFKII
jgi:hypothetical protein